MKLSLKKIAVGAGIIGLLGLFATGSSSNDNNKIRELKSDFKQTQQETDKKAKEYERAAFDQKMKEIEESLTNPPIKEEKIQEVSASENDSTSENAPIENTYNQGVNTQSTYTNSSSYSGGDKDCGDFATHSEAQAFFEAAGAGDPHRLDRDGDGIACEDLP